ncbi:hypothetical protein BACCIP111895_04048 [Neobacillus rhizosphaerae]|uniref:Preprotein translocase subunit SecA n=1 Tax=Neobacillus rhizosphaerae TaxID=2880965 RepID=A0ABN8KW83_9BACI|nr:SEC-C metal-binding domain-containing protein [Neobacillus rhizosphaerae]CAH2716860.1 hypothetical protein BACCIP111895_04048 [Neobacillus rhizosphaerae]
MEKINRNDLCPCGSGKKYKKCCGVSEAISITQIIENEIDELQKQILQFAYFHFGNEIQEDFEDLEEFIDIEHEQEREFYELIHAIWFTLFEELDDGERIIEKYIVAEAGKIKRPKLRQILQLWTDARVIAGKVIRAENNKLTVEDGLTSEQIDTIVANVTVTIEEGSFFIGIMVPYEQNYLFFPSPFDLPDLKPEHAFSYIKDSSLDADYETPQEYLTDFFMEVLSELPMVGGLLEIEEMDWPEPIYKEVADIVKAKLQSELPPPIVDTGIILWFNFCEKKKKRIQNPNLYAAALHYLLSTIVPLGEMVTQKDLALAYGVSSGGVSSIVSEMESVLSQEIAELIGLFYVVDDASSIPPFEKAAVIEFPNKRGPVEVKAVKKQTLSGPKAVKNNDKKVSQKISRHDEDQAQNIIFETLQTQGPKRYKLAQEALSLNPNCVDAYVILAENESSLEDAVLLYEKGMHIGEQALGKAFFEENKGYFWGLFETRPFMRAKFQYAESLYLLGKINEATQQYEELLELNPMDNQGVRDTLVVAYIDRGEYKKARNLMQQYDEESTQVSYNKLLLELHENGFTAKAAMMLKAAKKENKYVLPYLTGKKRLPVNPPDYYSMGDENEAIVYADRHLHLWRKIEGLGEWLKSIK